MATCGPGDHRFRRTARCAGTALAGCLLSLTGIAADSGETGAPPATRQSGARTALDLRLGDLRRYMDPALLDSPPADFLEEIVVRGRRPEPLPEHRAVPQNLGAIIYAFQNPLQAWRILLPDPHQAPIPLRTVDDPKEAPGSFRAKILEPGAVYD